MASSSTTTACASCTLNSSTTKPGIVNCIGCERIFCMQHIGEHRQELSNELDLIISRRDDIQAALESTSFEFTNELAKINTWVNEAINRVYKSAENAFKKLEELATKRREDLQLKCQELNHHIESYQQSENYFECDLANLKTRLDQLALEKTKSNISVDLSDVNDSLDNGIKVSFNACLENTTSFVSFIEKVMSSKKPDHRVSIRGLAPLNTTFANSNIVLIDDVGDFLLVDSDGSMRSLSRECRFISDICWSAQLKVFFYTVTFSSRDTTNLISFDPFTSLEGLEELATPQSEGPIKKVAVFHNSMLLVCESQFSTDTVEEWSLNNRQWHKADQPKYRWRSPISCLADELIETIVLDQDYIVLIISRKSSPKSFRFELRNRKMVVLRHISLTMKYLFTKDYPSLQLCRVPDGWLLKVESDSMKRRRFALISNDLKIYKQSYLENSNVADVAFIDEVGCKEKFLAVHDISSRSKSMEYSEFSFYKIQ